MNKVNNGQIDIEIFNDVDGFKNNFLIDILGLKTSGVLVSYDTNSSKLWGEISNNNMTTIRNLIRDINNKILKIC